jgi:hypothetical protein
MRATFMRDSLVRDPLLLRRYPSLEVVSDTPSTERASDGPSVWRLTRDSLCAVRTADGSRREAPRVRIEERARPGTAVCNAPGVQFAERRTSPQ